ncbi:MAG: hypothetical protein MUO62_07540 [Anaerolineales bacterium]|nr:hypothetical protein [Anaerolineales bacterium]
MNRAIVPLLCALGLVLSSCQAASDLTATPETVFPTPTFHDLFVVGEEALATDPAGEGLVAVTPTVADFFTKRASPTPHPTKTPSPTVLPSIADFPINDAITLDIYTDTFNPNWRLIRTNDVTVHIRSRLITHEGRSSIEVTPRQDFSRINFIVSADSTEIYPRERVLGFRFWINPGDSTLLPSDLGVSILGSNADPFFVEGDNSVANVYDPVFSETRLYFLGFNHSVPPYTWVEVIVWLDDLINDPIYDYVVGFYLKNDETYLQTFYIDDVRLILTSGEDLPEREP